MVLSIYEKVTSEMKQNIYLLKILYKKFFPFFIFSIGKYQIVKDFMHILFFIKQYIYRYWTPYLSMLSLYGCMCLCKFWISCRYAINLRMHAFTHFHINECMHLIKNIFKLLFEKPRLQNIFENHHVLYVNILFSFHIQKDSYGWSS